MKKKKEEYLFATIKEIDGQLVLEDPVAFALICAINKINCKRTFDLNADRIQHFKNRITEKGLTPDDVVIVVINVDDVHGGPIADVLMPDFNWQEIRDRGETPYARGLATRAGIQEILENFDEEASKKLKTVTDVAVVVVNYGVAEVYSDFNKKVMGNSLHQQIGNPEYVYHHGLSKIKRGKNPSASLSEKFGGFKNPRLAFNIAKLLTNDTENMLLGKPFLRSEINWLEKYKEHLAGPHADIPYGPTSGVDNCVCSICFYRNAPPPHNPKRDCQMASGEPKKFFGFPNKMFLPAKIAGKDLGHYCPYYLSPFAE